MKRQQEPYEIILKYNPIINIPSESIATKIAGVPQDNIKWIDDNFGKGVAKDGFMSILNFLEQKNYENLIPDFINRNTPLDELRGESLFEVCPELEFFNG